jgi:hypothetical protein
LSAAISPNQTIQEVNKEEGKDLEMEDALNEEERNQIKEDRINTKLRDSPYTRQFNEEMDDLTLEDLSCKPCDEEEADKPKQIWKPLKPTVKEVEEHNLTHLPFRNWCIFCVKGKAKDDPHKRRIKQDEEQEIPIVSIDYMFMESRESRIKRK